MHQSYQTYLHSLESLERGAKVSAISIISCQLFQSCQGGIYRYIPKVSMMIIPLNHTQSIAGGKFPFEFASAVRLDANCLILDKN